MATKLSLAALALILSAGAWRLDRQPADTHAVGTRSPVLVELFTSEGCSSCPPADQLLQRLDEQRISGVEAIVLSEHVDYWNDLGWKDPYSAHLFSERQTEYARRFGLESAYTPQMIVDGTSEFVGSDLGAANKSLSKAATAAKIPVELSSISIEAPNTLHARVTTGQLPPAFHSREVEVYAAVALDRAESHVPSGENAGHNLEHVSVVQTLIKLGVIHRDQPFAQDIRIKLQPSRNPSNLRVIVFLQEPGQGRVAGAAWSRVASTDNHP